MSKEIKPQTVESDIQKGRTISQPQPPERDNAASGNSGSNSGNSSSNSGGKDK
jgi:hypothetical protein